MSEKNVWGIHAGKNSDADSLFLSKNVVAIGWVDMGDLSVLPNDREAYKKRVQEVYPNIKSGAIPNYAGQLYRFAHELKKSDYVVYPSKSDRKVHIGQVSGEYEYKPTLDAHYPNIRKVQWLKEVPRTSFSQGALYEIGSAMSFFKVKTYTDEFLSALEGNSVLALVDEDETVEKLAEVTEENTKDFIIKTLSRELKGHPFSDFVAHLLKNMGYNTRVSPEGPDDGVDIIAHKDELGFEPPVIKVQVKSNDGSIGDPVVSALYGKVASNEFGLLVTLGFFTKQAINFAKSKSNLRLIDGDELVDLIFKHYEKFDSKYKGLLPLKSVYVPEKIEED